MPERLFSAYNPETGKLNSLKGHFKQEYRQANLATDFGPVPSTQLPESQMPSLRENAK